ncbi:hypothetical protein BS47DRAFT_1342139 [Hydnum rufescens UP504]|uniref:Uncharacterized protein n=1 Tax=Hydnum rufescens UP504 TaxID=1448309 RepID=A0A9P6B056_9AGAM|nr:hypothetical protein BS47DRAFT_1342139 [Hydnum rufescens UP504]
MATSISFDRQGLLFDMDGTLVDSTEGVLGAWASFLKTYSYLDLDDILRSSHGVRTEDNLRKYLPDLPEDQIPLEAARFELEIVLTAERTAAATGQSPISPCEGVASNIIPLLYPQELVKETWAVCTSAARTYASKALALAKIPVPTAFVTADDIKNGKPAPDPYLLGAQLLGLEASKCVVFEDAPAGIISGRAGGCTVIAVLTTHDREAVLAAGPTYILETLLEVKLERIEEGWRITLPSSSMVDPRE